MDVSVDLTWILNNLEYIGGAGLVVLALFYNWPRNPDYVLLRRFDLDPEQWRILGHDLGSGGAPYHVRALGLIGTPDFVAQHRKSQTIKAFDYKHRTYKGKTRPYEVYQVSLYCMALESMHPGHKVIGAIKFKNAVVDVPLTNSRRSMLLKNRDTFRAKYL